MFFWHHVRDEGVQREREAASAVTSHLHTFTLAPVELNNVFAQTWGLERVSRRHFFVFSQVSVFADSNVMLVHQPHTLFVFDSSREFCVINSWCAHWF